MLRGILFICLTVPAWADTVFLYNGTAIDGVIKARHEASIELQIGNIGRIFVDLEAVESIEKNDRDGSLQSSCLSLERKRQEVGSVERSLTDEDRPPEAAKETAVVGKPVKRYASKEDVSPAERKRIEQHIYDLTRQKPRYRVRAERHLTGVGEPAVPFLLDVIDHENHLVRLAVLRILQKVGNDAAIPGVIDRLEDENPFVRDQAVKTLRELTGQSFGFRANASAKRRAAAVAAWRAWYKGQQAGQADHVPAEKHDGETGVEEDVGAPEAGPVSGEDERLPTREPAAGVPDPAVLQGAAEARQR